MKDGKEKGPVIRPETREWAVRVVGCVQEPADREEAIRSVAGKVGCKPRTVKTWLRKVDLAGGFRPGLFTTPQQRIAELEREVIVLTRENASLRAELRKRSTGPRLCE